MEFRLPELGEGVYEAEMTRWLVSVGDQVAPGQGLLEVLTDKATMEVPSPFAGVVTGLDVEPSQQLKIGQVVLHYDSAGDGAASSARPSTREPAAKEPPVKESPARPEPTPTAGRDGNVVPVKASPAVRQMAHKLGVDLATVRGTGPEGRVLIGDLPAPAAGAASPPAAAEPAPDYGRPGTRVKLQGVRRKIAEHMVASKRAIPHYTYVDECDVTEMVRARAGLREAFAARGVKLTYLAFILRAVAGALREVPVVNATFDEEKEELALAESCHLGVAVAAPAGLVVPVVRDADRKSLLETAREIQRLSDAARAGSTRLEDLRGGTFTVTSIGNIGGLFATPIIHHPQVGILGVGRVVRRPVYDAEGRVVPAEMMYLSFSFDHRVLDGAVGAAFGNAVIKRLQKPLELLLDG